VRGKGLVEVQPNLGIHSTPPRHAAVGFGDCLGAGPERCSGRQSGRLQLQLGRGLASLCKHLRCRDDLSVGGGHSLGLVVPGVLAQILCAGVRQAHARELLLGSRSAHGAGVGTIVRRDGSRHGVKRQHGAVL